MQYSVRWPLFPALLIALLVGACSSSGSDSNGEGEGDAPPPTVPSNPISPPVGTNTDSLSHAGVAVPRLNASPVGSPRYSSEGRDKAQALTDDIGIIYSVVDNQGGDIFQGNPDTCSSLGAQYNSCSVTNLHIKNASGSLNDGNWKLYFHSIRRILRIESDEFTLTNVNGDLHFIEPAENFQGFAGEVKSASFVTEYNHLIESDFMPRYWLVREGAQPVLIPNTDEDTDESGYTTPITGDNAQAFNGEPAPVATSATRYVKNEAIQSIVDVSNFSADDIQARIVPTPRLLNRGVGNLDISGGFSFAGTQLSAGNIAALNARMGLLGVSGNSVPLSATINATLPANGYRLAVEAGGITLIGADRQALFNAAQSLLALVQIGTASIPFVNIEDEPRFTFRGMHLDVARNFQPVESVKSLLDQMAAYKLNTLHLHLSDDEGWRLEIASLPELTRIGGVRQFQLDEQGRVSELGGLMPQLGSGPASNNRGSGFYSGAQFVELIQYAADREIRIIPEFDMPAHARAAVVAMRARAINLGAADDINIRVDDPADTSRYRTVQNYDDGILNPCVPGTYNFIRSVVTDVKALYTQAGQPLDVWHMGGDEAGNIFKGPGFNGADINSADWDFPWERSPVCASFISDTTGVNALADLQPYFVRQVAEIVANEGISTLFAFQDIFDDISASELATQNVGVGFWEPISSGNGVNNINGFSNRGFQTVVGVPDFLYFDFPQEIHPEERGYYWATRFTDTRKVFGFAPENLPQNAETSVNREGRDWSATGNEANQGFAGMQGYLWGETVRTPQQMEYMLYPRLLALAERAWHEANWELEYTPGQTFSASSGRVDKDNALNPEYALFAHVLAVKELPKLDAAGIEYRIPVPGAIDSGGTLLMNSDFPGLQLEYSVDGVNFTPYATGASTNGVVAVRARSANGARVGRAADF